MKKEENVNYLDTSGNAFILFPPDITIAIEGKKREINKDINASTLPRLSSVR